MRIAEHVDVLAPPDGRLGAGQRPGAGARLLRRRDALGVRQRAAARAGRALPDADAGRLGRGRRADRGRRVRGGARPGVDTRSPASTSAAAGGCAPRASAPGSSCACSTASPAAGSGRGCPSSSRARSCAATSGGRSRSSTSRRARAGARRGGAAPGGKSMKRLLLTIGTLALLAPPDGPGQAPADAGHPHRGQQLGGHGRPRGPAALQGPQAAEHRPRPRRADGRDPGRPGRARVLPRRPPAGRRGPRPARRRRLHVARRPPAVRVAAELRRRRRDPAAHRGDRLAHEGRGQPRRPHGALADRRPAARLGLDRPQGPRHRHPHGPHRRQLRVRRPAAREQLLGRRQAHLPRQHRHGLHARPTTRCWTARRATAGSRSSTRRRCRCCGGSTWAPSWPRPATRT